MPEIENNDLLYETNERGELILVRSIESIQRAYLRFTNKTTRPVDVWWRDFDGVKRHYVRIKPRKYYDINSYVSHPWEFTDVATKERYVISNKPIFRAPPSVGDMMYRTNWNITITTRSLRHTVLLYLASMLSEIVVDRSALGLPKVLLEDLENMMNIMDTEPPIEFNT